MPRLSWLVSTVHIRYVEMGGVWDCVMDAKTVLLLGIGMAVLALLGYCVAPSRSASLFPGRQVSPRVDLAKRHAALAASLAQYRELHGHAPATGGSRIFGPMEHNLAPLRS